MVSSTVSLSTDFSFCPQSLARNKPTPKKNVSINPRKKSNQNRTLSLKNASALSPSPPPSSISSASQGGDATTYTCLPPKDDFFIPLQKNPIKEVKLSDLKPSKNGNDFGKKSDLGLESEDDNGNNGFDYENFELYEVGSDSDYENNDDFDEYCDEDEEILNIGRVKEDVSDGNFDEDNAFEGMKEKEKGVPAVMRCFDRAKIYVKAGDGGNGVVAFRREKFVPFGGPSGGDGGRGGNVYVEVDGSMNSLLPFRQSVHFRAGRGGHGHGRKQNGGKGEDVVVKVPPGTIIKEAAGKGGAQGDVLLELLHPGQKALLLPGGRGGRGNASFKTGMNRVPKIAEKGEEGPEM